MLNETLSDYETTTYDLGSSGPAPATAWGESTWTDDAIDFLIDGQEDEEEVLYDLGDGRPMAGGAASSKAGNKVPASKKASAAPATSAPAALDAGYGFEEESSYYLASQHSGPAVSAAAPPASKAVVKKYVVCGVSFGVHLDFVFCVDCLPLSLFLGLSCLIDAFFSFWLPVSAFLSLHVGMFSHVSVFGVVAVVVRPDEEEESSYYLASQHSAPAPAPQVAPNKVVLKP